MARGTITQAAKAAFPYTASIMAGFLFTGMAYGILMRSLGFPVYYPILLSITVFAGAMQFVLASLLLMPFAPLTAFVLTLLVNARHIFYGLALLPKYGALGPKKWLMVFALCDETFSINCTVEIPEEVDRGWFYFFVTFFDYFYWQIGVALGALCGSLITLDITGIDFVMTALFLSIFANQWSKEESHVSSLAGLAISLLCLLIFGPERFIVAAMVGILLLLTALRPKLDEKPREEVAKG